MINVLARVNAHATAVLAPRDLNVHEGGTGPTAAYTSDNTYTLADDQPQTQGEEAVATRPTTHMQKAVVPPHRAYVLVPPPPGAPQAPAPNDLPDARAHPDSAPTAQAANAEPLTRGRAHVRTFAVSPTTVDSQSARSVPVPDPSERPPAEPKTEVQAATIPAATIPTVDLIKMSKMSEAMMSQSITRRRRRSTVSRTRAAIIHVPAAQLDNLPQPRPGTTPAMIPPGILLTGDGSPYVPPGNIHFTPPAVQAVATTCTLVTSSSTDTLGSMDTLGSGLGSVEPVQGDPAHPDMPPKKTRSRVPAVLLNILQGILLGFLTLIMTGVFWSAVVLVHAEM
ncbi:hypothetical protein EVJ58_g4487 [Rhodofomes roseus]|uniref:Transmembrane protein n=1 Tax=Rhodofomes roseus TaxID=34475 RepID=A0A4Y9YIN5_9APHY|nr:hypothetical protein EVJ58_g4487 [Rhodofomes roseus]